MSPSSVGVEAGTEELETAVLQIAMSTGSASPQRTLFMSALRGTSKGLQYQPGLRFPKHSCFILFIYPSFCQECPMEIH